MKTFYQTTKAVLALAGVLLGTTVLANVPGGGTNGAAVTLTDGGTTVTLANGVISLVITKASGVVSTINYTFNNNGSSQTINVLGGGYSGGKLYWENSGNQGLTFTYALVTDPASTGGNYAEAMLSCTTVSNVLYEIHFSLLRGNSGFYLTPIWFHRNTDDVFSMGECRDNIYSGSVFNWMSVDATRNKLMPVYSGSAIGVDSAPVECSLWTNGIYAGQYEDKYKYTADYGDLRAWGWSSVGTGNKNIGLWDVPASFEYMASGPLRRELTSHMGRTILNTPHGGHYGFCTDSDYAAGEVWAKVCGPHFIYCNNITNAITQTNTAAQTLYADALAQADAETAAWPYGWFTNSYYATAAQRGTVTGKIVINDIYNPNASASNLWVGLTAQPTNSAYDFQKWYKPYHFWVKTDANGNFTIPDVIATNGYTLYAFGPGAAGTFQSQALIGGNPPSTLNYPTPQFTVNVTGGATNNLGNITWTPTRVGPTVFELGYPDRTAGKFRHGEDWWVGDIGPSATAPSPVWTKFLEYPFDFPSGPNYIVGQSRWTTDWNFCQPVVINNTGAYDPWGNNSTTTSTLQFNLPSAPGVNGSLYIATASSYQGPMIIKVNGNNIAGVNGYDPSYDSSGSGSDASVREGIHGLFADMRTNIPSGYLQAGVNTITFTMRKSGYLANHTMYDYIRMELPGYIPPAPGSAKAYAGNNGNLIAWPVQPGATSYNILRSTTSGSGYASITNGVIGPVCGSGLNNATYLDTTAANGTAYYYVVRAVNPVGSSTNSPEASATPSASIATNAPTTPTGLTIASVAHQSVTLNWNAVSNANFYTIYRATLFNNGGGASNVLGTIVLANNITNATYTDTSPTDGSIYRYAIAATGAGGTSTNSNGAAAVPKPSAPATPPMSLFITSAITTNSATNLQQDVSLTWNAVSGAIGYAIYRATSLGGPYTFLQSVSTTKYWNGGLGTNTIYYYRVAALNAGGVSTYNTDAINPKQAAPTNLVASGSTALPQVVLSWPTTPGATSYTVKRGTSIANETTTVVTGYPGTSYTNSSLVNGTAYFYVVTATGTNGTSGNSPEASATPGSSVWISTVNGTWGATTNWSGGGIASGSGSIADFATLSLPTNVTVTLDSARTVGTLRFKDTSEVFNWSLVGTNILTLGGAANVNVMNQSAAISTPVAGTAGLNKTGAGTLTIGGATNTFTGGVTNTGGALGLDFSAANSPAANLVPSANNLTLGGATLQIIGGSNVTNAQTFSATTLNVGASAITAAPVSGTNLPTITLATITANTAGVVRFTGPATIGVGGGNVASNANITTTASGNGAFIGGNGAPFFSANFATVGLYDFAATTGASSPYTVVGGSQISGFYTAASGTAPAGGNLDVTGNITGWSAQPYLTSLRFNTSVGANISVAATGSGSTLTLSDILVTPNVGAYNVSLNSGSLRPAGGSSSYTGPYVIWQNNPAGELILNSTLGNSKVGAAAYIQAGDGTVAISGNSGYTNQSYLHGGFTLISGNGSIGSATFGMAVNLNGGTLVGNGTFALDNAGANLRPINLLANGGGLAATAGNALVVGGLVGSAAGAGPLTIGISALSANNFTQGLLPGTGSGTANPTPVNATGIVMLTNANYFTGGTVLQSGTLNINGINALGGANYGGLTFAGGTLQYVTNFPGSNGSADLTSIGTAGITVAAGGGTIDVNGNAIAYAGSVGNSGSGSLVVKSSLAGGSLSLQGANTWLGSTTATNITLFVSNTGGSATGAGDVTLQNNSTLTGDGAVNGSVSVATGGTLMPGGVFNSLNIGNDLTLASGSTTRMQIQHSPLSNNIVNIGDLFTEGGALIVTNVGGSALTNGDTFQLFNAANYVGAFSSLTLPPLATNLVWNTNLLAVSGSLAVVQLTSPVISELQINGNELVISGSNGANSWPFILLTKTNLATPTWTPVATNQFDADGNFSITNVINPAQPQTFYRLQLQ